MNTKSPAYEIIKSRADGMKVRLCTPAHQGRSGKTQYFEDQIYGLDFTWLNRSRTEGVEKNLSQLYNTKQTFFLTGGATQGMLVVCALLARKHRRVALGLNSHAAVIHGLVLSGLEPFFIPSQEVMPTAAEAIAALEGEGKDVTSVILTAPSYDGKVTDIGKIVDYCRERKIELVVDEAHGTHFPFLSPKLDSGLSEGADVVVHSLHKYAGSLVQTALLHLPAESQVKKAEVQTALSLFETTTRSNLLILSIEDSISTAFGQEGRAEFVKAARNCDRLREQIRDFGEVLSYNEGVRDPLKLFLQSDRASGAEIEELLYSRGIDDEYADENGVLLIFSFQHTEADFEYVGRALKEIQEIISPKPKRREVEAGYYSREPVMRKLPRESFFTSKERWPLGEALGKISCRCLTKVPPGSPILIPGEEITDWHLQRVESDTVVEAIKG
ncbi:MAG: aminotransferase class I/II-fold pyridoxal phosphate-dependent enzyme [Hormoscilla sp. GUM202]|nr:aminotransferase class I/II-fold pyridoxal phosphate-dependent enzyme [Hormoscilla sp. GUM202]